MQLKYSKTIQKGFTLSELLIATTMLTVIMTVTMNFMLQFNSTMNRTSVESELSKDLRSSFSRIEKELTEGSKIIKSTTLPGDSTATASGPNLLLFEVPLYSDSGFIVVDNNGDPVTDIVKLEVVDDVTRDYLSQRGTGMNVRPQKMLFSLYPSVDSTRTSVQNQTLAVNLMPKNGNNYKCEDTAAGKASPVGCLAKPTFTYLNSDGSEVSPTSATDEQVEYISQVKILLWNEKEYGRQSLNSRREFEIRLRNWSEPDSD